MFFTSPMGEVSAHWQPTSFFTDQKQKKIRSARGRRRTAARFSRKLSAQAFGVSEPLPLGVEMVSQLPLATYFQALP